jgi:glutamate N-acetyltransferase/amino-acid N-acetyltransferase
MKGNNALKAVRGGVTAAKGFTASGVSCGIKKRGKDLALIVSDRPAQAAGTLTVNPMKAPCVNWAQQLLSRGTARAIIANSGNANCCTGKQGRADAGKTAAWTAAALKIKPSSVFIASTGVIGRFLPMDKMAQGIRSAVASLDAAGSLSAAQAIMTTDTRPKEIAIQFKIAGKPITVGGIAKGSGMIAPNMATMLAFLTTDATADAKTMRQILKAWVPKTFNAITVDGEVSTNDMVLILANGASETPKIKPGSSAFKQFSQAIGTVCGYLAKEIVRDGEGVTRLFTVLVTGAKKPADAQKIAQRIGNSALVKTMIAGRDPNWGRIAAAAGATEVAVNPDKIKIQIGKTVVFKNGEPARIPISRILKEVDQPEVPILVDLGLGRASAQITSGDFTEDYIRINARYTT